MPLLKSSTSFFYQHLFGCLPHDMQFFRALPGKIMNNFSFIYANCQFYLNEENRIHINHCNPGYFL